MPRGGALLASLDEHEAVTDALPVRGPYDDDLPAHRVEHGDVLAVLFADERHAAERARDEHAGVGRVFQDFFLAHFFRVGVGRVPLRDVPVLVGHLVAGDRDIPHRLRARRAGDGQDDGDGDEGEDETHGAGS